ncbi:hypothetical protein E3U55_15820 [Filobacillus milosensis]|uniref:Uncharacterized protein n=1 Tax=Filobacillus milosensis TaxID=94137 RepID=A0A4Y8IC83_9BACI|nr:hypothetical protein [Filobacillus milosensis]TFB13586.1 hypothetical protein E3U55_15820 [Filobacillus milosensis]
MPKLFELIKGDTKQYIVTYKVGSEIGVKNGILIKKEFDTLEDAELFFRLVMNKGSVLFSHLLE